MIKLPGVLRIIAEEAGEEAAMRLAVRLAGCQIKFPSVATLERARREQEVQRLARAGARPVVIARRTGLTPRRVYQILRKKI